MPKTNIRNMTLDALFIAAMVATDLIIGFIPTGIVSITVLHIYVIIVALLGGWRRSWVLGLTFGIISLIRAYLIGSSVIDIAFQNPLISVLPRLLFGIISGIIAELFIKKYAKKKLHLFLYSAVIAAISTIIHSVITLSALGLFAQDVFSLTLINLLQIIMGVNGLIEIAVAVLVVPVVVTRLYSYSRRFYERKPSIHEQKEV